MKKDNNISPIDPGKGDAARLKEEKLLAYLDGKLPPEEQHEVEAWLADEGMESDAVDGLQELAKAERTQSINTLNNKLRKTIGRKTRKARKLKTDVNQMAAVLIILLLIIVAYCVIRYL
jgi:anti-sigma factor RsiW